MAIKINVKNLSFSYRDHSVLNNCSFTCEQNTISAIVGSSGVGKSTFIAVINRLWETVPECKMSGLVMIRINGELIDIYGKKIIVSDLRRKVGTVFQNPNPLPMSIYKNVAFPLKLSGEKNKDLIYTEVEKVLRRVQLWDEVHNRLSVNALNLSGGQQQRLCIARALMLNPEVMLFDEPTSSLDEKSRIVIEELLVSLKEQCTIIMISHYLDQVMRIADNIFSLQEGRLMPIIKDIC